FSALKPQGYAVLTIHRAENTDDPAQFEAILQAIAHIDQRVVWPVHPRTRHFLTAHTLPPNLHPLSPLGYLDMMALVRNAKVVLTDSGGLQKEAYWLGVPCITLRNETEWPETLSNGWNKLSGNRLKDLPEMVQTPPKGSRPHFGTTGGVGASTLIVQTLLDELSHA
ncbi:MAG TPA: UDP-N-acetylglucosamine 2-epimerase (non-hydrolyzing), partial [Bacteroidetes bacterium]|nr:UDP-N-acetylglucosamine 2-epimerase (non-hydrolyzing) [Bacteroidota bacterium]